LDTSDEAAGRRLDAEIGDKIAVSNVRGLLTPYEGLTLAEQNKRTYRLGGHFKTDRHLETRLEASRQEIRTQHIVNTGLMLKGKLNWQLKAIPDLIRISREATEIIRAMWVSTTSRMARTNLMYISRINV